jgi:hypothetical protein
MWLFTKYGFFSAVCARKGNGGYGQPIDHDLIMVRARVKAHLQALKQRFPEQLNLCEIQSSQGTDYAHRMFVPKIVWADLFGQLATETSYDNFKSAVQKFQKTNKPINEKLTNPGNLPDQEYLEALVRVWTVMHEMQVNSMDE